MNRRELLILLGGTATAVRPLAAAAQQPAQMRRIGVLMSTRADDPEGQARYAAFLQGLEVQGWVNGQNARIDTRWTGGRAEDIHRHAMELVALAPDVILASG